MTRLYPGQGKPKRRRTALAEPDRVGRLFSISAAALVVSLSACGDSSGDRPGSTTSATQQKPEERKPRVPASLGRVESAAEDTIDLAHAGDRAKAITTSRALAGTAR